MTRSSSAARSLIRRCRVARLGTLSRRGRPSINPLYFARHLGHIWLGTSDWTLAARNVRADSLVVLLFQGEASGRAPAAESRILRVSGHAVLRTDRRTQRAYNIKVACRYLLRPGEIRSSLRHGGQRTVRRAYRAQNRRKGGPCVIDVVPDRVEFLDG